MRNSLTLKALLVCLLGGAAALTSEPVEAAETLAPVCGSRECHQFVTCDDPPSFSCPSECPAVCGDAGGIDQGCPPYWTTITCDNAEE